MARHPAKSESTYPVDPPHRDYRLFLLVAAGVLLLAGSASGQTAGEKDERKSASSNASVVSQPSDGALNQGQATSTPTRIAPIHIVPFGQPAKPLAGFAPRAGSSNQGVVQYWGGPVISNVHVVQVMWGSFVDAPSTTGMEQFYTDVTNSNYFSLLAEYSTVGLNGFGAGSPAGSNQIIGPGVFDNKFTINPSVCPGSATNATCTITDAQIQTELTAQINASHLPQPAQDAPTGTFNTIYMIYFPPGVTINLAPGVNSCQFNGFCAYHSNVPAGLKVPYGVFPDFGPTGGCSLAQQGCGFGPTSHDNLTSASSHELFEAVTDVDAGSGTTFAPPLGWVDQNTGEEIGDFCNHQTAQVTINGNTHTVQTEMSNMQRTCVSAPAHFQVTASTANISPGVPFNVNVAPTSSVNSVSLTGYNDTVTFTSTDTAIGVVLPADYTFVPATDNGLHMFSVTLQTHGNQTVSLNDKLVTQMTGTSGVITVADNPDLTIVSTHSGNFRQGDTGDTYMLTVTNVGNLPTTGTVTATDTVSFQFQATAISGTGWMCSTPPVLTCTRSDALAAGASYPAITVTVNVGDQAQTPLVNVAQVSGGGELNTSNDVSNDSTIVTQVADLTVTSSHSGSFSQGQSGETYTLVVQNAGTGPTVGTVTVTDTLPAGLSATAISGTGWTCVLATVTCTRSDVLGPLSQTYPPVVVTVNIDPATPLGNATNTAVVSGGGEVLLANDTAQDVTTITAPAPDLNIISTHSGSFTQGQTGVTYTLNITNAGNKPTSGQVTVTDNLSFGLLITSLAGTGWNCSLAVIPSCNRSDVLPASSSYPPITVIANVSPTAQAQATNQVTVTGGGQADSGDTFNDPTTIIQLADMAINDSFLNQQTAGSTGINWTIFTNNVGAVATSAPVNVNISLSAGATITAMTGNGWTCTVGTATCTRSDTLAAGQAYPNITVTLSYAGDATSVTQTAAVSGGGEVNTANDSIVQVVPLTPGASLSVLTSSQTVTAGAPAVYQFFLTSPLRGTVSMTCSNGVPPGAACTFTPSSIASPAFNIGVGLTITTTGPTRAATFDPPSNRTLPLYALLLTVLGLAGIVVSRLQRKRISWAVRIATCSAIVLVGGCGGSHTPSPPVTVTPPGNYTITVVANNTAANVQATLPITLSVH